MFCVALIWPSRLTGLLNNSYLSIYPWVMVSRLTTVCLTEMTVRSTRLTVCAWQKWLLVPELYFLVWLCVPDRNDCSFQSYISSFDCVCLTEMNDCSFQSYVSSFWLCVPDRNDCSFQSYVSPFDFVSRLTETFADGYIWLWRTIYRPCKICCTSKKTCHYMVRNSGGVLLLVRRTVCKFVKQDYRETGWLNW